MLGVVIGIVIALLTVTRPDIDGIPKAQVCGIRGPDPAVKFRVNTKGTVPPGWVEGVAGERLFSTRLN